MASSQRHPCRRRCPMRLLHTRLRVADLDRSIAFYGLLGMTVRGRSQSGRGNQLVFLQ
ncbi:MAG: VOC family protein, partial [Sulfobacillus sp.]